MRVIFQTGMIPVKNRIRPGGDFYDGFAQFTATVYEPGETIPDPPTGATGKLMSEWRAHLRPGQPIALGEMKEMYIGLPRIELPLALTDALPDDAQLSIVWRFRSTKKSTGVNP